MLTMPPTRHERLLEACSNIPSASHDICFLRIYIYHILFSSFTRCNILCCMRLFCSILEIKSFSLSLSLSVSLSLFLSHSLSRPEDESVSQCEITGCGYCYCACKYTGEITCGMEYVRVSSTNPCWHICAWKHTTLNTTFETSSRQVVPSNSEHVHAVH